MTCARPTGVAVGSTRVIWVVKPLAAELSFTEHVYLHPA
jgi:hypothetical protein